MIFLDLWYFRLKKKESERERTEKDQRQQCLASAMFAYFGMIGSLSSLALFLEPSPVETGSTYARCACLVACIGVA